MFSNIITDNLQSKLRGTQRKGLHLIKSFSLYLVLFTLIPSSEDTRSLHLTLLKSKFRKRSLQFSKGILHFNKCTSAVPQLGQPASCNAEMYVVGFGGEKKR